MFEGGARGVLLAQGSSDAYYLDDAALARQMGVTPNFIFDMCADRTNGATSPDTLTKVIDALGLGEKEASALHMAAALDRGFRLEEFVYHERREPSAAVVEREGACDA